MANNPYTWPTTGNVAYTGGTVSIQGPSTTSASNYYSVNLGAGGGGGGNNSNYTLLNSNTSGPVWTSTMAGTSTSPGMTVKGIMEAEDVKIDGVSMKETMQAILDRLAILVPDPAKLEKFAALKASYEHYKTLERLCTDNPPDVS